MDDSEATILPYGCAVSPNNDNQSSAACMAVQERKVQMGAALLAGMIAHKII